MSPDRQGAEPLHIRIGQLRDKARAEAAATPAPTREQVSVEDAAIRTASLLAAGGQKPGAERRSIFNDMKPGMTVNAKGVAKTTLSRQEKIDRVKTWASSLTEEARTEFMMGDKYDSMSEKAQDIIGLVFGDLEERAYEDSIGVQNIDVQNIDLDTPTPEVDDIIGEDEEDETDESYVDPVDEASLNGETYYYTEESP
jgi:hypothetical protein